MGLVRSSRAPHSVQPWRLWKVLCGNEKARGRLSNCKDPGQDIADPNSGSIFAAATLGQEGDSKSRRKWRWSRSSRDGGKVVSCNAPVLSRHVAARLAERRKLRARSPSAGASTANDRLPGTGGVAAAIASWVQHAVFQGLPRMLSM